MIILGIDPGFSGALAFFSRAPSPHFDDPRFLCVNDMPTLALVRGAKNKREIDPHLLSDLIESAKPGHAFIEKVGSMPGQGVSSVFAFGEGYGIIKGVLAALQVPFTIVSPQRWKKALGVPAAKDGARARASQLLPGAACNWPRVKDDGRAEATMIALYGAQQILAGQSAAALKP
jgi:crossover junction endodeoxyribonuclease RuvC